jgi:hypothetical protein
MPALKVPILLFAVALSLGMAVVGGLLTGNQLARWFTTPRKPRFQLPLWGVVFVGLFGYIVFYPAFVKACTNRRIVSRETP